MKKTKLSAASKSVMLFQKKLPDYSDEQFQMSKKIQSKETSSDLSSIFALMVLKMDMEELTARREKIHQKIKEVIKEIGGITIYDPRCVSGYALIVAIFEILLEENGVPLEKDNNDGVDLMEENQNSPEKITELQKKTT